MNLDFRTSYWDDPKALSAFKVFAHKIHGLDFEEFEARGYWDSRYTPFSLFEGDTVIANVCIYSLDAVIDGRSTKVAQISGVGTLPEYRHKGLGRKLTEVALEWASEDHEGVFLFSNPEALVFYEKLGFSAVQEYVERTAAPSLPKRDGATLLDPDRHEDLSKIYQYAKHRSPVSQEFGVMNAKLVMFHVLHGLRRCVLELPDLQCLVMSEREGGVLKIYDIIGAQMPGFNDIYPYLADDAHEVVEFHFFADQLGLEQRNRRRLIGNNLFVRGAFLIENPVFPYTARA